MIHCRNLWKRNGLPPLLACIALAACAAHSPHTSRPTWQPATYRGIVVGRSTVADVFRSFGQPARAEDTREGFTPAENWYFYEGKGDFEGELGFFVNTESGVVQQIILSTYEEDVRQEEVTARYGSDFVIQRYNSEPEKCDGELSNEDEAVMYEDRKGPMVFLEYRNRGVAVEIDDSGKVLSILYVREPIGNERPLCNGENQ